MSNFGKEGNRESTVLRTGSSVRRLSSIRQRFLLFWTIVCFDDANEDLEVEGIAVMEDKTFVPKLWAFRWPTVNFFLLLPTNNELPFVVSALLKLTDNRLEEALAGRLNSRAYETLLVSSLSAFSGGSSFSDNLKNNRR